MIGAKMVDYVENLYGFNPLKSWSDVDMNKKKRVKKCSHCVRISEAENQKEISSELYLPPELMEKIICYFDGRTILKFKSLSNSCNTIANNALRFNKLWKKICLNEIPKKDYIILFNKHFDPFTPLDSLSEVEYEELYKCWLHWQSSAFSVTRLNHHMFPIYDNIEEIICYKHNVTVVFPCIIFEFSLVKNNETGKFKIRHIDCESKDPNTIALQNPRLQTSEESMEQNNFITYNKKHFNRCPLHDNQVHCIYHHSNLINVNTNIHINVCCWVRTTFYNWKSDVSGILVGHSCDKLTDTIYTCVVHGVLLSLASGNSIVVHCMYRHYLTCRTLRSWLDQKYMKATALYIYTDILFIGTQNSYLLAYRLQCWDDLFNLKKKNLLLETKLQIGKIQKINIIDYKNVKAIIVATVDSSIHCLKIN